MIWSEWEEEGPFVVQPCKPPPDYQQTSVSCKINMMGFIIMYSVQVLWGGILWTQSSTAIKSFRVWIIRLMVLPETCLTTKMDGILQTLASNPCLTDFHNGRWLVF